MRCWASCDFPGCRQICGFEGRILKIIFFIKSLWTRTFFSKTNPCCGYFKYIFSLSIINYINLYNANPLWYFRWIFRFFWMNYFVQKLIIQYYIWLLRAILYNIAGRNALRVFPAETWLTVYRRRSVWFSWTNFENWFFYQIFMKTNIFS